jgi:hypothetical protein
VTANLTPNPFVRDRHGRGLLQNSLGLTYILLLEVRVKVSNAASITAVAVVVDVVAE